MYDYKDLNIINMKAKFYSKELWDENFDIPIKQNNRLKRCLAWFKWFRDNGETMIEIAGKLLKNKHNELTIDAVLIHEMCHWHSHKNKLVNYDLSKEFQELVINCGGSLSNEITSVKDKYYGYCPECDKEYLLRGYKEGKIYYCFKHGCKIQYTRMEEDFDKYIPRDKLIELNNKFKEYYKNMYKLYA